MLVQIHAAVVRSAVGWYCVQDGQAKGVLSWVREPEPLLVFIIERQVAVITLLQQSDGTVGTQAPEQPGDGVGGGGRVRTFRTHAALKVQSLALLHGEVFLVLVHAEITLDCEQGESERK